MGSKPAAGKEEESGRSDAAKSVDRSTTLQILLVFCAQLSIRLHPWWSTEMRRVALACKCIDQSSPSARALASQWHTRSGHRIKECKRMERALVSAKRSGAAPFNAQTPEVSFAIGHCWP
jgi:hypothetical protein